MSEYSMHEAKTNLSKLVKAAQGGEEVLITNRGEIVVKLVAVSSSRARRGIMKGKITYPQGEQAFFDADEEIAKEFEVE